MRSASSWTFHSFHRLVTLKHNVYTRSKANQTVSATIKGSTLRSEDTAIIALQFQNDFAVLRYLLLYSVGNFSPHDNFVSHSTIQPANKPNPKAKIFSVTFGAAIKNMDKDIKLRQ